MSRRVLLVTLALVAAALAHGAWACPACVPAPGPTIAERLAAAESALGGRHADWLKGARERAQPADAAQWRNLVAFHLGYLEHPEPAIAEVAYVEIARAPYEAMLANKPRLDPKPIAAWLDDPRLAHRAALYTLLLGIAGGPEAKARIDRRVAVAHRGRNVTDLAAMLVASMELRGVPQVAWTERSYFADRSRSAAELQAVLVALQVQGGADATIPRDRAVAALRNFIRTGHPLAGYAAPVLMGWQAWDAVPDYVALLAKKTPQHPASTIALLHYLQQSARPEALSAVAAYRAAERRTQGAGAQAR